MRFPWPKPPHAWRRFFAEVVIVLIGELVDAVANVSERMMVNQCLRDRIDQLITRLRASSGDWAADPMPLGSTPRGAISTIAPVAYRAPTRTWGESAWEAASAW